MVADVKSTVFICLVAAVSTAFGPVCSGGLVITEFMADPAALTDATGEYFEVYNPMAIAVNVQDLTISDDGSDSFDFPASALVIAPGEFFVFARSASVSAADAIYSSFVLGNTDDEIVISIGANELARLNYNDGSTFGAGVAAVLNDTANNVGGLTNFNDYIAEVVANDTIASSDIGSPGVAGSTVVSAVPEPSSVAMGVIVLAGVLVRVGARRLWAAVRGR
ncbi:MAG: lamin tail domain-containing protein [Caldilineaceae bacterium]|nr:lamin tail domain-containing protein [Planctomycetales bacterium]MCB0073883.1 lamin tail domain-containing protein [Caldilineaceae bacterium]